MAMMTWMRRISPYLLAAVLIAFIVSLAYFGTQRGSSGGGGRRRRRRDGRRGHRVGRDLRPRVPGGGRADPADGRRPLDGGAAEGAAPPRAGGRAADRRAARRQGGRPRGHPGLRRRARRADHAHRRLPGGRPLLARPLRAAPRDDPAPDDAWRLRERVPGGAGAAAPAGADRGGREGLRGRGPPGLGSGPEPRARGLPPGRGRDGRDALGDRRRARRPTTRRIPPSSPSRSAGGPRGDAPDGERAGAGRDRCRRRGGLQGPTQPVRAARADEGLPRSRSRCRRSEAAPPRTRRRPGPRARSRGSGAAPISPRSRGRCRRTRRRRAGAATSA